MTWHAHSVPGWHSLPGPSQYFSGTNLGTGWMTLVLAILIAISVAVELLTHSWGARFVISSLFGSEIVVLSLWSSTSDSLHQLPSYISASIGTGFWLSLGAAVAGLALSIPWVRRSGPQIAAGSPSGFSPLLICLAAIIALASHGPWLTLYDLPPSIQFSFSGTSEGVGWTTTVIAILIVIGVPVAVRAQSWGARFITPTLFGSEIVVLSVWVLTSIQGSSASFSISVGWGFWVCLGAAVAGLAGSIPWIRGTALLRSGILEPDEAT